MSKKPERVKSAEEIAQETEFYRRRNLRGVEVRYLGGGKRSMTMLLMLQGTELGSKTEITTRGKVTQVLYVIPSSVDTFCRRCGNLFKGTPDLCGKCCEERKASGRSVSDR